MMNNALSSFLKAKLYRNSMPAQTSPTATTKSSHIDGKNVSVI